MSLTIFERKPLVSTADGDKAVDMTYPSIRYEYSPFIENAVIVTDFLQMRPDLLSRTGYGSTEFWDVLLKFNGVSNPFSIETDDLFLIPSLDDMTAQLSPSGIQDVIADSVRQQYVDVSKKAKQDPKLASSELKRREAQRKLAEGNPTESKSNLPPNIAEAGDREIIIKSGKVYFGPDVSRNKKECETPLSKSEFVSRLIKQRLKK